MKRSTQTKAPAVALKRQRKMLAIVQNDRLLDMLKEGTNYTAVRHHHGIKEPTVCCIKEESTKF